MIYESASISEFLTEELAKRVQRNSRYSLRAFAKALSVNPAELSQVLRGSRKLSLNSAVKISRALGFSAAESRHFLMLLQKEKGKELGLTLDFLQDEALETRDKLPLVDFEQISDWYHFAILNLLDTKNFEWSANVISQRLGISQTEAKLAMRKLESTGLVSIEKTSRRLQARAHWEVGAQIPSMAIRKYHRQVLEKAAEALDNVPTDEREFQGIGMVVRTSDLARIKKDIDRFTDEMSAKYHRPREESVYQLEIALFPLTKDNKPKEKL